MDEIKIVPERVEPVLSSLKQRTQELDTTDPSPDFFTSLLDFIDQIQTMEEAYYQAFMTYKTSLIRIEKDVDQSILEYKETDEQAAQQIGDSVNS